MKIIIIGSSTGGPFILDEIFSRFPSVNACILIIQHLPTAFTESFRKNLQSITSMKVIIGEEGQVIAPGTIIIAPGDRHLILQKNRTIHLDDAPKIHGVRPAADSTMCSLVSRIEDRILGIILTGMGQDGTTGLRHIKSTGGVTWAQDPETAPIKSMPMSAIEAGVADKVYSPVEIRTQLVAFCS